MEPTFESLVELIAHLEKTGQVLWAGGTGSKWETDTGEIIPASGAVADAWHLYEAHIESREDQPKRIEERMRETSILVSTTLLHEMRTVISDENSDLRRHSIWPIVRSFVYVDISDFSKMSSFRQSAVVRSLVHLVETDSHWNGRADECRRLIEAKLCIGDGYIYVIPKAIDAACFAAHLARRIETGVSLGKIEFHFRIGVHIGEVRSFRDPGRDGWNYVGDGVNGGQRVLSAIGKDTDDVIYVSSDVRAAILKEDLGHPDRDKLLRSLENKGRRPDKHGKLWRVYQLNHYAAVGNALG
jgi:class 3 adenylate cyclase